MPPTWMYPHKVRLRQSHFEQALQIYKRRKAKPNLLPHQLRVLNNLQHDHDFLIVQCNKNLGPAIIEHTQYIKLAFRDHLNNPNTYLYLNNKDLAGHEHGLTHMYNNFLKTFRKHLSKEEWKYL